MKAGSNVETLRKRVEHSVLKSETVARNRQGITVNVSANAVGPMVALTIHLPLLIYFNILFYFTGCWMKIPEKKWFDMAEKGKCFVLKLVTGASHHVLQSM